MVEEREYLARSLRATPRNGIIYGCGRDNLARSLRASPPRLWLRNSRGTGEYMVEERETGIASKACRAVAPPYGVLLM